MPVRYNAIRHSDVLRVGVRTGELWPGWVAGVAEDIVVFVQDVDDLESDDVQRQGLRFRRRCRRMGEICRSCGGEAAIAAEGANCILGFPTGVRRRLIESRVRF